MRNQFETWHYPSVSDHASAVAAWKRGDTLRGYPERRKLTRGHRNKWITRYADGSIGFTLGGVEIVRWIDDANVFITPCSSTRSFTQFANAFLPLGLRAEFSGPGARYVSCGSFDPRHYRVAKTTHFACVRGTWGPVEPTEPWVVPLLDKKAASEALKANGYAAFADWAKAVHALGGWARAPATVRPDQFTPHTLAGRQALLSAFDNPTRWMEILTSRSLVQYTDDPVIAIGRACEALRLVVYIEAGAVKITSEPYLDGGEAPKNWAAAMRKYRSVVLNT